MGHVEDVAVCPPEEVQDSENIVSPATVNTLLVVSTAEHTTPTINTNEAAKQESLAKLMEALTPIKFDIT